MHSYKNRGILYAPYLLFTRVQLGDQVLKPTLSPEFLCSKSREKIFQTNRTSLNALATCIATITREDDPHLRIQLFHLNHCSCQ